MSSTQCSICTANNLDWLEELGEQALKEEISWREAARQGGLNHHQKLKNHMLEHYISPHMEKVLDFEGEMAEQTLRTKRLLLEKARVSPPEVQPMYLAAIHTLENLRLTKPSQSVMVQALKTATELTGMKMEQQMMLQFAEAAFGQSAELEATVDASDSLKELEEAYADILDVESEEVELDGVSEAWVDATHADDMPDYSGMSAP